MNFFKTLDAIYCINLEKSIDRKSIMLEQFKKFDVEDKVKFLKAYTPDNEEVKNCVKNFNVYPVQLKYSAQVAITFSFLEVWKDISKNGYKYAMVVEDDIQFNDNSISIGNEAFRDGNVYNSGINTNKPYIIHLIGREILNTENEKPSITNKYIKYGNGCYIINSAACNILIKRVFPITIPCDDYLHRLKAKGSIKTYSLVPCMCYERSHLSKGLKPTPRLSFSGKIIFDYINNIDRCIYFYSDGRTIADSLYKFMFDSFKVPSKIIYNVNEHDGTIFLLSNASVSKNINDKHIIIGARTGGRFNRKKIGCMLFSLGKLSRGKFRKIGYGTMFLSCPLLIMSYAYKLSNNFVQNSILDITDKVKVSYDDCGKINKYEIDKNNIDPKNIIHNIVSHEYIVTDLLEIITVCHSYSRKVIWVSDTNIGDYDIRDYYTLYDTKINVNCFFNNKPLTFNDIKNFPNPKFPAGASYDYIYNYMPFINTNKSGIIRDLKRYTLS